MRVCKSHPAISAVSHEGFPDVPVPVILFQSRSLVFCANFSRGLEWFGAAVLGSRVEKKRCWSCVGCCGALQAV